MKKTKLIALVMVVAIMLMGAGYAAWTDSIQFDQEVNTGYLDVHFVDLNDEEVVFLGDGDEYMTSQSDYSLDYEGGQNEWDKVKLTINNVYPGAEYNIQVLMKNSGTIPVKFASITSPWQPWEDLGLKASRFILEILDTNGNLISEEIIGHAWDLPTVAIPVGGFIRYKVFFMAPDDIPEDSTMTTTLSATFKQFNK